LVDREVFAARLARLERLLADLRGLATVDEARFLADRGLQAQAERWLHLTAECLLDMGHHLIADRGWPTPASYREVFATLGRQGVLAPELAARLEPWAGLRNVIVHLYLEIDHRILHAVLRDDLDDVEAAARALAAAAREATGAA
jgi:uncharacterized protein YutE (UPF0331/DUF86 family)